MNIKFYVTISFFLLFIVFIAQNMEVVEVSFLFWSISVTRAILLILTLILGLVIGWVLHSIFKIKGE